MLSLVRQGRNVVADSCLKQNLFRWLAESRLTLNTEGVYTSELKFASLTEWPTIPVFRTLGDDGKSLSDTHDHGFPEDLALDIYRTMLRLHVTDGLFYEAQRQGRLSFYLTSFGEEATTVGTAAALDPADEAFLQYREQGFLMWRGFTVRQMADQCYGNALEKGKGRQMPIHYGTPELHVHTVSSVLATQIPHAVGAAFALKAEAKPNVAVTFFGDGAASEGDFHAALNFAATLELPVLFVCRNNGYAISTPTHQQYKSYCVGIRGPGYGIRTIRVDGGDPRAVYLATLKARELALEHNCPILIEVSFPQRCRNLNFVPRLCVIDRDITRPLMMPQGQGQLSYFKQLPHGYCRYRSDKETKSWNAKEPVGRFFQFLSSSGRWTREENDQLRAAIRQEVPLLNGGFLNLPVQVIDALAAAEKVPKPPLTDLFTDGDFWDKHVFMLDV